MTYRVTYTTPTGRSRDMTTHAANADEARAACVAATGCDFGQITSAEPLDASPDRYRIANEASDGKTVTFLRHRRGAIGWTDALKDALFFPTLAHARAVLEAVEATRDRAGRRFIVAELDTPDGPGHRELTEADAEALTIREAVDSMSADADLYFERYPEADQ